jgi:hypothetical protein
MPDHTNTGENRKSGSEGSEEHAAPLPTDISTGAPEASSAESMTAAEAGVHPIVARIAVAAAVWFLAVTWISFAWGGETDYLLAIVSLFFVMFFGLFFLTASYSVHDSRWPIREMGLRDFLASDVGIGSGRMRGRDVLIEIALIPVALAFAATLIGLAWLIFG